LEIDREMLLSKHKKDREMLELELEEKKHVMRKYEMEFKDMTN